MQPVGIKLAPYLGYAGLARDARVSECEVLFLSPRLVLASF